MESDPLGFASDTTCLIEHAEHIIDDFLYKVMAPAGKQSKERKWYQGKRKQPYKDAFQRMNFLYQAAHLTLKQDPDNLELVRFYIYTMKMIAQRLVLRIEPEIKRTICKKCSLLLVPGVTAISRQRGKREQHQVVTCISCGHLKRFNSSSNYKLWTDIPEARISMFGPTDDKIDPAGT
ncbi:ribonuclease P protein subunit p21-like [Anneissia japonica]|uniref:ribonuclease P protein subunit p21-like n=1 Tax=Anneissia japonica TaxID=1529436 RepID=UPI001425831C|nr:ribonuclease P protein subunit p21-like [Anneissia japonica]